MKDFIELLKFIGTVLIIFIGAGLLAVWLSSKQCEVRWSRSGVIAEWGVMQGCMLRRNDGTWIPENMYIRSQLIH